MKVVLLDLEPAPEPLKLAERGLYAPSRPSGGPEAGWRSPSPFPVAERKGLGSCWTLRPPSLPLLRGCHVHSIPTLLFLGVLEDPIFYANSTVFGVLSACSWQEVGWGCLIWAWLGFASNTCSL